MTYEEALSEVSKKVYRNTDDFEMRVSKETYKRIVEALEKQIPKKPFKEVIAKKNTRMVCPVCFVNLHYLVERQNYCPDCGQALDWGGTE